jgi:hypothetical protein
MERGSGSRRSSRRATGEEAAAAAAGTWGDAASAGGNSQPNYPCSICRHGFTNAQALGGHMNIHRRDASTTGTASAAMGSSSFATYDYSGAAYAAADAVGCGGASQSERNLFGAAAATHDHH